MKNINIKKVILASQSPRRRELLEQAGVDFEIIPADIEEILMDGEAPDDYVRRLSREKALHVAQNHPDRWVVGADTTVVMEQTILEKPSSEEDARMMLETLSGKSHIVYTGFTVCCIGEKKIVTDSVKTDVIFKSLSRSEIEWYVSTGEPFDKAGGYAIQGMGAFMVKSINGSYSNVVGLPVCEVIEHLVNERVIVMR